MPTFPKVVTHMVATGGDVIDLGSAYQRCALETDASDAGVDVWVRPLIGATAVPDAPASTPAPSGGETSEDGWVHLKGAGKSYEYPRLEFANYRYLQIFGVAAGGLRISAQ